MGFLSFTAWQFAAAGALCAAGPIIIHLLNRRRYRVVKWAAMDFLRQALQRNRRILQIRDMLLLILRTAAVLLFGLALARPYFATRQEEFDERQPLHAVIVIDNSLSMAYESLEGTLLDQAKERARELIEKLPTGSRVSIIPACGAPDEMSVDAHETKDNALEALDKVEIVDRSASLLRAANEARRACEAEPELAKRIVFISDQQELNWRDARQGGELQDLPPMQVIDVGPPQWENTWISDVRVQDGLADVETPATVVVELSHRGHGPRRDLVVSLQMGDTVVGEKTVTLEPGPGTREVNFECTFNTVLPEPDKPVFVAVRASIAPDRLAADDERFLAVPVVAALSVVFVDQYGPQQEDPIQGRLGETRHLRKLLAPKATRTDARRQLVSVRHITAEEVTKDRLADARLVVVAGLREPGEMVGLLREYVQQGGQLLIAAGADFNPAAWNEAAWLNGSGILPQPLAPAALGATPEATGGNLTPFFLSFDSLAVEEYFHLAGAAESDLRDLYAEPFFFKAVSVDDSPAAETVWKQVETQRLEQELALLTAVGEQRAALSAKEAQGEVSLAQRQSLDGAEAQLRAMRPAWLLWTLAEAADESLPHDAALRAARLESLLLAHRPRVLARYDLPGRPPFLVSRRIGRGEVVFCSTGLLSSWNTLPKTNAILIFDRLLRGLVENTLPRRNLAATERLTLPLPPQEQNLLVTLARPGNKRDIEPLDIGYIAGDERGVTLTGLLLRGVYRVTGTRQSFSVDVPQENGPPVWEVPLVVNGPAEESDLTPLRREQFDEVAAGGNLRWVGRGEAISLAGTAVSGRTSWWWLALSVLLLLLLEMSVLAWPTFRPIEHSYASGTT